MSITLSSPLLLVYCAILAAVLGAVFGSFINCAAWRIAHGESFLKGRSHCAECGHELKALDLVPVFSYLFLRGKCRYCGKKISPRYMITELLLAAAFVGIVLRFGISGETLRYLGLSVILLGLSLVDLETYRIPNGFIIAGIIWWAVTIPLVLPRDGASGLSAWIGPSLGVTVQPWRGRYQAPFCRRALSRTCGRVLQPDSIVHHRPSYGSAPQETAHPLRTGDRGSDLYQPPGRTGRCGLVHRTFLTLEYACAFEGYLRKRHRGINIKGNQDYGENILPGR